MKNIIRGVFIMTAVAFAGLYLLKRNETKHEHDQRVQLEQMLENTEQKLVMVKTKASQMKKTIHDYKKNIAELVSLTNQLAQNVNLQAAVKDGQLEKAADAEGKVEENKFASGLAEMMDTPEMQDTIRLQLENALINPVYGNFIKNLGLDEMDAESLKNLLVERNMVGATIGMKIMKGDLSKEEIQATRDKIKKEQNNIDEMIKGMLDDDQYREYEKYKETQMERVVCNQFNQHLAMSDSNMDPEQKEQLIYAMFASRKNDQESNEYVDMEDSGPSDLSDEKITKYIDQQQRQYDKVLEASKGFLETEQQESLNMFFQNLLRQQEIQMKMAAQMFKKSE